MKKILLLILFASPLYAQVAVQTTDAGVVTILQQADSIVSKKGTGLPSGANFGGGSAVASGPAFVGTLAGDQATGANVTPVNLTGLVFAYVPNSIYVFRWVGAISSAAATTGCGFQLDVSTAVTQIAMRFEHQLANTGTLTGGSSIADDASAGVSSGIPAAGGIYPVSGFGLLRTGANAGTAQLRFRSETTAITTAKAGLTLIVEKVL